MDSEERMMCIFFLMTTSLGFILGFMLADTIPEGWEAFVTAPILVLYVISFMVMCRFLKNKKE